MLHELEKKLEKDEDRIYISNYTNTAILVDLTTAIRKVPLNKFSCSGDVFECTILLLESSPPVQLNKYWASSKNKKKAADLTA